MATPKSKIDSTIRSIGLFMAIDAAAMLFLVILFMKAGDASGIGAGTPGPAVRSLHIIAGAVNTGLLVRLLKAAGLKAWLAVAASFIAVFFCFPVQWLLLAYYIRKAKAVPQEEPAPVA